MWGLNAWHHQFLCNMTPCVQAAWSSDIVDKPENRALEVGLVTFDHDVTFRRSRLGNRLSKPPYSFFLPYPHWAFRPHCKKICTISLAVPLLIWTPREGLDQNPPAIFQVLGVFLRSCTCIVKSRKGGCFHKSATESGCEEVIWPFLRWF